MGENQGNRGVELPGAPEQTGLGSWIPQLFYDLISRVLAGAFVAAILMVAWVGPRSFLRTGFDILTAPPESGSSRFLVFVAAITVSYFTGLVCRGLYYLAAYEVWCRLRRKEPVSEDIYEPYYRIKVALPAAGGRIAKLKAERSMVEVMFTGVVLAVAVQVWRISRNMSEPGVLVLLCLLLLLAGLGATRRHLRLRFDLAREIHSKILHDLDHPLSKERDEAGSGG